MNKHQQSGMTTLLITSMLLIVALLFSLASYKNLFYQIKRTQNEVLARQAHWAAEGGLECGFAEISNKSDVNTSLVKCTEVIENLTLGVVTNDGKSVLTSEKNKEYKKIGYKKIAKTIVAGGAKSSGVIKSSADLYLNGDHAYYPDPNIEISNKNWMCSLLRYKNKLYLHKDSTNIKSNGFIHDFPPYNGFNTTDNKCDDEYLTDFKNKSKFSKDVSQEINMDLFKETFGTERSDWQQVKNNGIFESVVITDPTTCGTTLADNISDKNRYLWISGDCFLDHVGIGLVSKKSQDVKGVFLLFHQGLLSIGGVHDKFLGVIYHFEHETINNRNNLFAWEKDINNYSTISKDDLYIPLDHTQADKSIQKRVVFYMYGSFTPSGGFMFDTPNQVSYFNIATNFSFNGELLSELLEPFGKPKWQQGSWHDF
ncbi:hypothetical protein C9J21_18735 [Photobacterium phosphoreum]|uniref:hypothetical protein n=1 Tax=Photobacterium phosphoreum TaxID=659 RepID=UPI000D166EE0|nr:hypothetical protein [Photobacterium phosphoreum]PSW30433.1 hypothetical protein C9J21_18735 [Photobacterium phosphoreum]